MPRLGAKPRVSFDPGRFSVDQSPVAPAHDESPGGRAVGSLTLSRRGFRYWPALSLENVRHRAGDRRPGGERAK